MKKVILSVTNDLVTDQRVHRTALTLAENNFAVTLVGRKRRNSLPLAPRPYATIRMRLLFDKGPFFYAEYNIRLFLYLLSHRADILCANDLDTLPASYLASKLKGCKLVYDCHEYFTGVPELEGKNFVRWIWKSIEKFIFPKLKKVYVVNSSIAELYEKEYSVKVGVIRNVPLHQNHIASASKEKLGLPIGKKIILYQGAGINVNRGAEEAIQAMQYVNDAVLVILGSGDVIDILNKMVEEKNLSDKVIFIPKMPMEEVKKYTVHANIGLSLDKDISINYRYSLPNKIFDYIHAGVPVLASSITEIKKIFERYNIGMMIENHDPKHIAEKINDILNNELRIRRWKENLKLAAKEFCWENEKEKFLSYYTN